MSKSMNIKNEFVTFRIPNTFKTQLECYADENLVSVSHICRQSLIKFLRENVTPELPVT
jgi:hypothetical protein